MNIDLEVLHLNPLNYCDLMPRTTTVVLFAARSRVSCTCPSPIHARSSLCNLTAFLPLINVSHLQSPSLHPSYHLSDGFLLLSHIFPRTGPYLSLFVARRLVFTRCIPQARPQLLVPIHDMLSSFPRIIRHSLNARVMTCLEESGIANRDLQPATRIRAPIYCSRRPKREWVTRPAYGF